MGKCEYCDKELIKRDNEVTSRFLIRRFCDVNCSRQYNSKIMNKKYDKKGRKVWNKGVTGYKIDRPKDPNNYVTVKCAQCGKEKTVGKWELNREKRKSDLFFCNNQCHADWSSKNKSGENSPLYGQPSFFKDQKHTQEAIDKMKEKRGNKIEKYGEENPNYGKHHTQETKDKMRDAKIGKPLSQEWKDNIAASKTGPLNPQYGKPSWNKDIPCREETKDKLRVARLTQKIMNKDTRIERFIESVLKTNGVKYEMHISLPGRPDFFIEPNTCIFADGEYWHADPRKYKPDDIIGRDRKQPAKNIWNKDIKINKQLTQRGMKVIRLWEKEILNNPCIIMYLIQ